MCINDSTAIEKRGTPTATICAGFFARLGQIAAKGLGFPSLPITVVPYPFGFATQQELKAEAESILDEVIHILTEKTEMIEEEYRDRHTDKPQVGQPGIKV